VVVAEKLTDRIADRIVQRRVVDDRVVQEVPVSVGRDPMLVSVQLPTIGGGDGVEVRDESGSPGVHRDVAVTVV